MIAAKREVAVANALHHVFAALADASLAHRLLHDHYPVDHAVPPEIDAAGEKLETIVDELRFAYELLEGGK